MSLFKEKQEKAVTKNSSAEHTYILDPESAEEMARLINQDHFVTKAMGGVFFGLTEDDISSLNTVLDLACGPGGWVLDVAFEYPQIEVIGVDISNTMIEYAKARAQTQKLGNATFREMDLLTPLDFSDTTFDMVNARLLTGVLRKEAWLPFIAECSRVLRPGGILRLTEPLDNSVSNSPALTRVSALITETMPRLGYGFTLDGKTAANHAVLPRFLRNNGYQNVRCHAFPVDLSAGTDGWSNGYRNTEAACYQMLPIFTRLGLCSQQEAEEMYQQVLIEMHKEDFCCLWSCISVIGYKK
jgi:SAM-dependent methyltransferase